MRSLIAATLVAAALLSGSSRALAEPHAWFDGPASASEPVPVDAVALDVTIDDRVATVRVSATWQGSARGRTLTVALPEGAGLSDLAIEHEGQLRTATSMPSATAERVFRETPQSALATWRGDGAVDISVTRGVGARVLAFEWSVLLPVDSDGEVDVSALEFALPFDLEHAEVALTAEIRGWSGVSVPPGALPLEGRRNRAGSWHGQGAAGAAAAGWLALALRRPTPERAVALGVALRSDELEPVVLVDVPTSLRVRTSPDRMVLAVDTSWSVGDDGLAATRSAIGELVTALPATTRVQLVFGDAIAVACDDGLSGGSDPGAVEAWLARCGLPDDALGGSNLDALLVAADAAAGSQAEVVVFTDGRRSLGPSLDPLEASSSGRPRQVVGVGPRAARSDARRIGSAALRLPSPDPEALDAHALPSALRRGEAEARVLDLGDEEDGGPHTVLGGELVAVSPGEGASLALNGERLGVVWVDDAEWQRRGGAAHAGRQIAAHHRSSDSDGGREAWLLSRDHGVPSAVSSLVVTAPPERAFVHGAAFGQLGLAGVEAVDVAAVERGVLERTFGCGERARLLLIHQPPRWHDPLLAWPRPRGLQIVRHDGDAPWQTVLRERPALEALANRWRQRRVRHGRLSVTAHDIDAADAHAKLFEAALRDVGWSGELRLRVRAQDPGEEGPAVVSFEAIETDTDIWLEKQPLVDVLRDRVTLAPRKERALARAWLDVERGIYADAIVREIHAREGDGSEHLYRTLLVAPLGEVSFAVARHRLAAGLPVCRSVRESGLRWAAKEGIDTAARVPLYLEVGPRVRVLEQAIVDGAVEAVFEHWAALRPLDRGARREWLRNAWRSTRVAERSSLAVRLALSEAGHPSEVPARSRGSLRALWQASMGPFGGWLFDLVACDRGMHPVAVCSRSFPWARRDVWVEARLQAFERGERAVGEGRATAWARLALAADVSTARLRRIATTTFDRTSPGSRAAAQMRSWLEEVDADLNVDPP